MPKTITCPEIAFLKRKQSKRSFFLYSIDTRLHLGINTFRSGMSHSLQLHKKASWLLLCPLGLLFGHFKHTIRHVLIPSQSLKSIRSPCMCSPAMPPAAFRIFAATSHPYFMPRKNPALCNLAVSRLFKLPQPVALAGNPLTLGFLFGERLLHDRNEILQS